MPDDPQGLPESVFMFSDTLLIFDHIRHDIKIVSHVRINGDLEAEYNNAVSKIDELAERLSRPLVLPDELIKPPAQETTSSEVESNFTRERYHEAVEKCVEYIYAGDVIQVVNSQRYSRKTTVHPFQIYRSLRSVNPSPYMYYLNLDNFQIVGAAIETVAQVQDGIVATHPIAGTRPRGQTPEEEVALADELRNSEKQRAEHIMLVDLGRNDIGKVADPGTVRLTHQMKKERLKQLCN